MQTLNQDQAKEYLRQQIGVYLDNTGRSSKNNFTCIRGTHRDNTPSMSLNPRTNKVKCFSGECNSEPTLDIFDIIGIDYDLPNFNDQFKKACELYNINVEGGNNSFTGDHANMVKPVEEAPKVDYSEEIEKAHANIDKTDYPAKRGLTNKSIERFKLGYDANWIHPNQKDNPNAKGSPMLIIPSTNYNYLARSVNTSKKFKAGSASLFNKGILAPIYNDGHVFICEGEIDAMSLYELDLDAVAIGSTSNTQLVVDALKELKEMQSKVPELYILFDNDKAGKDATSVLYHSLKEIGIDAHPLKLSDTYKDVNDYYSAEPEQLKNQLKGAISNPKQYALEVQPHQSNDINSYDENIHSLIQDAENADPYETWMPDPSIYPFYKNSHNLLKQEFDEIRSDIETNIDQYNINKYPRHWRLCLTKDELKQLYANTSPAKHLQNFINDIAVNTPPISTGFETLDNVLGGGLYEGLYFIGAISSLGKTTLALQIADQIAQQESDRDIIVFSLEMSRYEIMAKTISRLTYIETLNNNLDSKNAKTTRGITDYSRYAKYSKREKKLITDSIEKYLEFGNNIFIHEGIGNIGVDHIRKTIERHIEFDQNEDKKPPIVIVDYLQILAPHNERGTDKQNTDKAVLELKRISRDFKSPVIAISSFNRQNYNAGVNMTAFKESGAIEYSADVVIGLQFEKQNEVDEYNRNKKSNEPTRVLDHDFEKQKEPREIQLKVLKNRNGITGKSAYFNYFAMFNYYSEKKPNKGYEIKNDFTLNISEDALKGGDTTRNVESSSRIEFE